MWSISLTPSFPRGSIDLGNQPLYLIVITEYMLVILSTTGRVPEFAIDWRAKSRRFVPDYEIARRRRVLETALMSHTHPSIYPKKEKKQLKMAPDLPKTHATIISEFLPKLLMFR